MIRLPVPIYRDGKVYDEVEIRRPRGGVLADTHKVMRESGIFHGVRYLLVGCVTEVKNRDSEESITDEVSIKSLIPKLPYVSAEFLLIEIMLLNDPDRDMVEGVYSCPRCGFTQVSQLRKEDGMEIDTRDCIRDLPVNYLNGRGSVIHSDFNDPVLFKNKATGETEFQIMSVDLHFPTIEDCIVAYSKYGMKDEYRLQYAMFVNALEKVNGETVDGKWKNRYGMMMFENVKDVKHDIGTIADEISSYGMSKTIKKNCPKCDKTWDAYLNTSSFFDSEPRIM